MHLLDSEQLALCNSSSYQQKVQDNLQHAKVMNANREVVAVNLVPTEIELPTSDTKQITSKIILPRHKAIDDVVVDLCTYKFPIQWTYSLSF